jgi:starvation-inducible DNA-binding protein
MINIGISKKNCHEIAKLLNNLLANEYILYTKTWKFHWNVKGKHFGALHLFFDTQRIELGVIVDEVAERIRSLDVDAMGTLAEFIKQTELTEQPGKNPDDLKMIQLLLTDHEIIIKKTRKDAETSMKLGDEATNNFLCELLEKHEKFAWMLRAHLQ